VDWQTSRVNPDYDDLAPDGSEIRLLVSVRGGSMVHCTLRPGQVTQAVRHRSVEEVWYCLTGSGQVWRRTNDTDEVVELSPGIALSMPLGVDFQFRATGRQPLEIVITTMPPWPGADEAIPLDDGHWPLGAA
jgi:mannose-6-phosphate isomerase-like protein (cupin superfamily)